MLSQDRLLNGFTAGVIAGVAMNIISLASYYLNITELRFLDWSSIAIFGSKPVDFVEAAFAQVAQLLFVGILGILFAYLIPHITSRNHLLRGWLFGVFVWFSLYGVSLLYKIGITIPLRIDTAFTDFVGASTYGLVLAEMLRIFTRKPNEIKTRNK